MYVQSLTAFFFLHRFIDVKRRMTFTTHYITSHHHFTTYIFFVKKMYKWGGKPYKNAD